MITVDKVKDHILVLIIQPLIYMQEVVVEVLDMEVDMDKVFPVLMPMV